MKKLADYHFEEYVNCIASLGRQIFYASTEILSNPAIMLVTLRA